MLAFPALGAVKKVKLFPGAEEGTDASRVMLGVKLVGAGAARRWALARQAITLRNERDLADIRRATTREIAPEIWSENAITEACAAEQFALHRSILIECIASVEGILVGDVDLASVAEPEKIVDLLDAVGLADTAVVRALEAQTPRDEQLFRAARARDVEPN